MAFNRVSVIGLGYIGLPTAAIIASRKITVIGVDIDQCAVDTINRGDIHIVEPDLDIVVRSTVSDGYLRATVTPEPADAFLIAVPTPFVGDDHQPDLSYIRSAARAIAPVLASGNIVILESTSPVGATEQMATWLAEARPDLTFPQTAGATSDIMIAHCPERVLPGKVMHELISNDRIIGGMTDRCAEKAVELYRIFVVGECLITDTRTAELAKLTENSFRDVNIAFANELSLICAKLGIDVWALIRLANRHPRVNVLQPGPGVGGHCIAVDPWFIVDSAPELARLIRTARTVNDDKPQWVHRQIQTAVMNLRRPESEIAIALYGITFKADIDDLRESPALTIARNVGTSHSGPVVVVEPHVAPTRLASEPFKHVSLSEAANADVHVLLVDHKVFLGAKPTSGVIVDTRGAWGT